MPLFEVGIMIYRIDGTKLYIQYGKRGMAWKEFIQNWQLNPLFGGVVDDETLEGSDRDYTSMSLPDQVQE